VLLLSGSLRAAPVASDALAYRMRLEPDLDVDTMQVGDRVNETRPRLPSKGRARAARTTTAEAIGRRRTGLAARHADRVRG